MLCERYALGRHAEGRGIGAGVLGPRPLAAAHVVIRMLGHSSAQEPAFGPVHARSGGRCRPEPAQHSLSPSSTAAPRRACTIWSWSAWKRNPRRPHQHPGAAWVQPARRHGRRAGRRARQRPRQAGPAGGRRLLPSRAARRPCRWLTVLTGRAAPARVGAAILRKPVTRAVRQLTRFSWLDGTNTASFGVASVADAPGGGGGGQVVGRAHRRAPGPSRAAALAA